MCKNFHIESTHWVSRCQRLPVCTQPGIVKTSAAQKGSGQRKQKQLSASSQSSKDGYKWLLSEPLAFLLFLWLGSFSKRVQVSDKKTAFSVDWVAVERCDCLCVFCIFCHVEWLHLALLWAVVQIYYVWIWEISKYHFKKKVSLPLFGSLVCCHKD